MERKLRAGIRPASSVARYDRPRLVVTPRPQTYMDVMAPGAAMQPVAKTGKSSTQVKPPSQPMAYFDVKPVKAPSQTVQRTSPTLRPLSKPQQLVADIAPAPQRANLPTTPISQPVVLPVTEPVPTTVATQQAIQETPAMVTEHSTQEHAEPATPKKKRKLKHLLKKPSKRHALHGMAALLFVAGIYVAVDGWLANQAVKTQATVLSAQVDKEEAQPESQPTGRDALSETKPAGVSGYKVAPDLPRAIKIPTLGVNARVLHLGVKKDNSLAAPSNIYDAGWYTASARPTDKGGAILIDGHVSGPTKPGVFYGLKKLKGGEEIVLERGDGQALTFVVKQIETVTTGEVDMLRLLNSAEPGRLGLNLITCGGEFDAKNSAYKSRVLVFAVQK